MATVGTMVVIEQTQESWRGSRSGAAGCETGWLLLQTWSSRNLLLLKEALSDRNKGT